MGSPSKKYISGHPELGQSPEDGFDCSGLVGFVLKHAGLHVPRFVGMDDEARPIRHASEYWDHYGVNVHQPEAGDLLFFSRNGYLPTHIGIVYDAQTYIHAPGSDETKVETASIPFETIASRGMGRILYNRNPIGFKAPTECHDSPTYRYHQKVI